MRRYLNPVMILILVLLVANSILDGRYSNPADWLMSMMYMLPGIVIGLSFHEFAHAFTAYKLGDMTPKLQGRVTINPAAHIDSLGLIALLLVGFGWGKPVQIDEYHFRNRRFSELLVDISGVLMNLLVAVVFTIILALMAKTNHISDGFTDSVLVMIVTSAIQINLVLMVFNLLPVPPLDGFNIIVNIFGLRNTDFYNMVYNRGMFILILLIVLGVTGRIISPLVTKMYMILLSAFVL
ncbi:MAG: site-2 protease family protein [Clostridia bacterium]|nr:site-2 protease family protein [Clostridia bacterium]